MSAADCPARGMSCLAAGWAPAQVYTSSSPPYPVRAWSAALQPERGMREVSHKQEEELSCEGEWNRLASKVVGSPSLNIFKSHLNRALGTLLQRGGWTR